MTRARITVVIPTMASRDRRASLRAAIDSIRRATSQPVTIMPVINGDRADAEVVAELRADPTLCVTRISTPSPVAAILHGRRLLHTEFFAFLDDDDEYLLGGLDARVAALDSAPGADFVITQGYVRRDGVDDTLLADYDAIVADPFAALFTRNWLASCNGLYRSASIDVEHFEGSPRHIHWTWLAFVLCESGKTLALERSATCRINQTPGSSSQSETYRRSQITLLERMLTHTPPPRIRRAIRGHLRLAHHRAAEHCMRNGESAEAWRHHILSLLHPEGWRHLAFTRKLLAPALYR